jgi:hypothetical protein
MSADPLDIAADRAELEREAALLRHSQRPERAPALCESCGLQAVHVTPSGLHWRFCPDCATDHLRRNQTA